MKVVAMIGVAVLVLAAPATVQAQLFFDNFDSYGSGSTIIGQGGWEGWDSNPGADATVTSAQAASAPNSLAVSGGADVVQQFAGVSGGTWYAKVKTYIPSSQSGDAYFIILDEYNHGGPYHWAVQLRFSASEGIVENVGGTDVPSGATTPIITDEWVPVIVEIYLDTNQYAVTYGGTFMDSQQWTVEGQLAVAAFDLFSDGSSESYMDDVWLDTEVPVELMGFSVE